MHIKTVLLSGALVMSVAIAGPAFAAKGNPPGRIGLPTVTSTATSKGNPPGEIGLPTVTSTAKSKGNPPGEIGLPTVYLERQPSG